MNKMIRILILSIALLYSGFLQAQDLSNNPKLQERITQAKLNEISKRLQLDEAEMKAFTPIYKRYEGELNALLSTRKGRMMQVNPDSLTTKEADQFMMARLDDAVKISTIRKQYYPEFKTVLTPQQVMKLYKSEAQLRRKVMLEVRKRFGNRLR